jgi:hypothetical protein
MELIFLVVAALVVYLLWEHYVAGKRRKELDAWAVSHALHFDPSRDYGLDGQFPNFDCLQRGGGRYAYNRISGSWHGYGFLGFDYHYETYSYTKHGRRTHHHHFSAVILHSPVPLKPLFIRPEGILDKITEFLGFDDIDFESTEFSRRFYVKSPDKRWAYDVIHQRTMEFLLASPTFCIAFDRQHVIAYRDELFTPQEFEAAARVLQGLLDRLPEYVRRAQAHEEGRWSS